MENLKPLLQFCRGLPQVTEDIKWEHNLVFSIGAKMFAIFDNDDHRQFSFKVTPENFDKLIQIDGIGPAPYLARYKWVAVTERSALPDDMLEELLEESYQLVAAKLPKKLRKELGLEE